MDWRIGRNNAAVEAAQFFGIPVQKCRGSFDLGERFSQRLALLEGENRRNLARAFAHKGCGAAHERRAFRGRRPPPDLETARR